MLNGGCIGGVVPPPQQLIDGNANWIRRRPTQDATDLPLVYPYGNPVFVVTYYLNVANIYVEFVYRKINVNFIMFAVREKVSL